MIQNSVSAAIPIKLPTLCYTDDGQLFIANVQHNAVSLILVHPSRNLGRLNS